MSGGGGHDEGGCSGKEELYQMRLEDMILCRQLQVPSGEAVAGARFDLIEKRDPNPWLPKRDSSPSKHDL